MTKRKSLIQNLTGRKIFNSKACFYKNFFIQNHCFQKNFLFRLALFICARKTQNLPILCGKLNPNVSFCVQRFFQDILFINIFVFKNMLFKKKFPRKLFLTQNLTRCKVFNSKSDALKILIQSLTSFKTFSPKSCFYLVFQVLTEWWCLLSTLIPTYFKENNQETMRVIDLVSRCTTDSCHTSLRLSICEE